MTRKVYDASTGVLCSYNSDGKLLAASKDAKWAADTFDNDPKVEVVNAVASTPEVSSDE